MGSRRVFVALGMLLVTPSLGHAELRFAQANVDLGELRGGPAYQHRFEFVNQSAEPIEILDIRLGCGCLQPVLEKRQYQAGEKGVLLMNLRTLGQPDGSRTWQAWVHYRQKEQSHEVSLILAAKIRNEVTVEPSIVAMSVETVLRQEVTITDHRPMPLKVATVLASTPAIRVSMRADGANITRVTLEVSRSALTAARQEETINIYTDDPYYRHLQVPITLMQALQAEVRATPEKVLLRGIVGQVANLPRPSSVSKLVRLRAAGDRQVIVARVEADHPALKCTWAAGPGNDATLKISMDPSQLPSPSVMAGVRVYITSPATTLTIPVIFEKD